MNRSNKNQSSNMKDLISQVHSFIKSQKASKQTGNLAMASDQLIVKKRTKPTKKRNVRIDVRSSIDEDWIPWKRIKESEIPKVIKKLETKHKLETKITYVA